MNKLFTLPAIGLPAIGLLGTTLIGCAAPNQTFPTTAALADEAKAPAPATETRLKVAAFSLPDAGGKTIEVGNWNKSKATVIMFVSTQCPVSNAYNERMEKLATTYGAKGVRFVGINSNVQENSAAIAEHSKAHGFTFAVLKDRGNVVADKLDAKVTPETYVVNAQGELVYHGQIDNSQNETKIKARPLAAALDALLAGKPVTQNEVAAFGCSIKREDQ